MSVQARPGWPRAMSSSARGRPHRARAGSRGAELARPLGQLLPGDTQLVRAAARWRVRRRGPRRLHVPGRSRGPSRTVRPGLRGPDPRSDRRHRPQLGPGGGFVMDTSEGQMRTDAVVLATGAFQRPHRPPADLPAGLLVIDADSYHEPGWSPCRRRARRRERADRMPTSRGAAPVGPRRDPRVRQGRVGTAPCRRTRHRLVARGDAVPRAGGRGSAEPLARLAANFQTTGRDTGRPQLPDSSRRRRDLDGTFARCG